MLELDRHPLSSSYVCNRSVSQGTTYMEEYPELNLSASLRYEKIIIVCRHNADILVQNQNIRLTKVRGCFI
jgi:hypothetical protein